MIAKLIRRRSVPVLVVVCAGLVLLAGVSWAYWTAQATNVPSYSHADSVGSGTQPTVTLAGNTATVTWPAATTVAGHTVGGYLINRYPTATGGTAIPAAHGTCAGNPVTTTSCTETALTAGTWYYTVTPVLAGWHGTESPRANPITATDTFALSLPGGTTTLTAGVTTTLTITANTGGQTDTAYTGAKTLTYSGPANAPDGTAPVYTNAVTFTNGVASVPISLYRAETTTLTVTATNAAGSIALTVNPAAASGLAVTTSATRTAGTAQPVTVTARDAYQNTATAYSGTKSLTWSGPGTALTGQSPVYPANPVTFSGGIAANLSVTCYLAQTTTLTVSDGTLSGTSTSFTVLGGAATQIGIPQPATQTAGTAFTVTLTALDAYRNAASGYSGAKTLTWSGPSNAPDGTDTPAYPANPVTFSAAGTATVSVTLVKAESTTLKATDGTLSGTSAGFTVAAGAPARLAWTSVMTAAALSTPCFFTCTITGMGSNKSLTAHISVTDNDGNTITNLGTGHTVTVTTTGGTVTSPLTISATGPADSTTLMTFTTQPGQWTTDSLTATSTTYTSATATATR